jgi:hypothetical protein
MFGNVLLLALLATPQAPASQEGLTPPWQAATAIRQLQEVVKKTNGALEQLQVSSWQGSGASNYVEVADSVHRQATAISVTLDYLAEHPDRFGLVVRVFIAMLQLEPSLDSLTRAARQYQGGEGATNLEDATTQLLNQREKLMNYTLELVDFVDNNTTASERELESCRRQLWRRAPEPVTKTRPKQP